MTKINEIPGIETNLTRDELMAELAMRLNAITFNIQANQRMIAEAENSRNTWQNIGNTVVLRAFDIYLNLLQNYELRNNELRDRIVDRQQIIANRSESETREALTQFIRKTNTVLFASEEMVIYERTSVDHMADVIEQLIDQHYGSSSEIEMEEQRHEDVPVVDPNVVIDETVYDEIDEEMAEQQPQQPVNRNDSVVEAQELLANHNTNFVEPVNATINQLTQELELLEANPQIPEEVKRMLTERRDIAREILILRTAQRDLLADMVRVLESNESDEAVTQQCNEIERQIEEYEVRMAALIQRYTP